MKKLKILLLVLQVVFIENAVVAKEKPGEKISKEYFNELEQEQNSRIKVSQAFVNEKGIYNVEKNFLELLPISGGIADLYESLYSAGVNESVGTAGFTFNERPKFSVYGNSHNWNNFSLQGLSYRSVLNTQKAIFNLPLALTDNWKIDALNNNNIATSFLPVSFSDEVIQLQYNKTIFGPTWMPQKTFDREPASQWGAPSFRRNFDPSIDLIVRKKIDIFEDMPSALHLSTNYHSRNFIESLNKSVSSNSNLIWQQQINSNVKGELEEIYVILNLAANPNYGIEKFRNNTAVLTENRIASGIIYNKKNKKYNWKQNILFASQKYSKKDNIIYYDTRDLLEQGKLNYPSTEFELQYNSNITINKFMHDMQGSLTSALYYYQRKSNQQDSTVARSFFGSASTVTLLGENGSQNQSDGIYLKLEPKVSHARKWKSFNFNFAAKVKLNLWANSFSSLTDSSSFTWDAQPNLVLNTKWNFSASWLKLKLAHQSIDLTSSINDFVNPNSQNMSQYQWSDTNNDSRYTSNEKGSLIKQQGGNTNQYGANLKHPVYEEADLSLLQPIGPTWKYLFRVNFRMYRNLYSVNTVNSNLYSEKQYQSGTETYTVFDLNRVNSSGGYSLVNNSKNALNLSIEMQLFKKVTASGWIFNFSGSVYSFLGNPPIGSGPDFNDIGEFDYSQADPNFNNVNNYGRTNSDRAYILKFIFGKILFNNFSVVNILHYRDGESLAQVAPIYGLSQGPIIISTEQRGGGLVGTPRYTYYLQWDVRMQAGFKWLNHKAKFYLDIYNLLDSQSEFREYLTKGPVFRDPYEVVMPRSIVMGIKIYL